MLNNVSIMENKIPIHVFSTMNEWMDFVFIVSKEDARNAAEVLDTSFGSWFDSDSFEACGDWLCQSLDAAEIEYEMFDKCDCEDDR